MREIYKIRMETMAPHSFTSHRSIFGHASSRPRFNYRNPPPPPTRLLMLKKPEATIRTNREAPRPMSPRSSAHEKRTAIPREDIERREIQLLALQQGAPVELHRGVIRERADLAHAVLDVAEEGAAATAVAGFPHGHGESGGRAFREGGDAGEGLCVAPVRGVGVRGEGVAAIGEGSGVCGDRAGRVDSAGGEDGEGVHGGRSGGGGGAEDGEGDNEELVKHCDGGVYRTV